MNDKAVASPMKDCMTAKTLNIILHYIVVTHNYNYPASHDVPYDVVWGVSLDGIGVGVRDGDTIAGIQDGRSAVVHNFTHLIVMSNNFFYYV